MARRLLNAGKQLLNPLPSTALAICPAAGQAQPAGLGVMLRWEKSRSFLLVPHMVAMRHALIDHARRPRAKLRHKVISVPWDDSSLLNLPVEAEECSA